MPRPLRIEQAGAIYHVTSRGNGRQRIFFSNDDYTRFLVQLVDSLETFAVALYAYALMQNHYHLLVRTRHPNLSRFMQRLNTSYALYARYKHGKPGHQLEGRYKARIIQGGEYAASLTRYVHLNPVKTDAAKNVNRRGRITIMESYPWSSYRGYVYRRYEEGYVSYDVLNSFGKKRWMARRRYRAYVESCLTENDEPLRRLLQSSSYAAGSEEYIEEIEERLRKRKTGTPRDRDIAVPEKHVGIAVIDRVAAQEYGIEPDALQYNGHSKGVGPAKATAIELACRMTGMTQRAIGLHYGGISSQAVSLARKKIRCREEVSVSVIQKLIGIIGKQSKQG